MSCLPVQELSAVFLLFVFVTKEVGRTQAVDCYTGNGESYRGTASQTENGNTCVDWDNHLDPVNYPNTGIGNHNYCRNPTGDVRPWCYEYTAFSFRAYCQLEECQSSVNDNQVTTTSSETTTAMSEFYEIHTDDVLSGTNRDAYTPTNIHLPSPTSGSVRFSVKAASDAHVVLSTSENDLTTNAYEFTIGGWANTKSVLRRSIKGTPVVSDNGSILDEDSFVNLWIKWSHDVGSDVKISFGQGEIVDQQIIMEYVDNSPYAINYMSVSTGFGSDGDWRIKIPETDFYEIHTDDVLSGTNRDAYTPTNIHLPSPTSGSVRFSVKAASDAHVVLSTYENDLSTNAYEFTIGGWANTKSVLRRSIKGTPVVSDNGSILDEASFVNLWIKWSHDVGSDVKISFGQGETVDQQIIMEYVDNSPYAINYMLVSTGFGSDGDWKINIPEIEFYEIHTEDILSGTNRDAYTPTNIHLPSPTSGSVRFSVKAASDAHVVLSTSENDLTTNTYELTIGGWTNTKSVLRRSVKGTAVVSVNHSLLDEDSFVHFWIMWSQVGGSDVKISFGQGKIVDQLIIMEYVDNSPYAINYMSVSTGFGSDGDWRIYIPDN